MFEIKTKSFVVTEENGISKIMFVDLPERRHIFTTDKGFALLRKLPEYFLQESKSWEEYELWMREYRRVVTKYLYDDELAKKFVEKIKQAVVNVIDGIE